MFYWSNINLICNNFRHNFCFQKHSKIGKHPSWFSLRKQFSNWTIKSKLLLSPSLNCSLEKVPYEFCRCKWKTNPIVFFYSQKESFSLAFIYEPCMKWSAVMHPNLDPKSTNQSETREAGPFWSFIKVSSIFPRQK